MNALNKIDDTLLNAESIKQLIDENIETYKISPSRIGSDYRGEKGFTAAYNGRQLLELLQNADDAKTDKVLITLDTKNTTLSIANNGTPFDVSGLRSLMLANSSSKNKKEFIGNKGLGFRSILNWVSSVKIKTPNGILEFSPDIAKREFERLIPDEGKRKEIIANEKDLPKGEIPFAILAIPDFTKKNETQEWQTIIKLAYKKVAEKDILEQLKAITPEVLLFLNHTIQIEIAGAKELDKILVLSKEVTNGKTSLSVNGFKWNVFDSGELNLPHNADKHYRFKIAWQNDLQDKESRFATYFPTQVAIYLPCLIHATFDLDPSRNYLNKTEDNEFILKQIAVSLTTLATSELLSKNGSDWKSYRFLTPVGKSENKLLIPFFSDIETLKPKLDLCPTVGGQYKKLSEVKYYGNDFSEWAIRNNAAEYFPDLLLPIPGDIQITPKDLVAKFSLEELQQGIGNASLKLDSIRERVALIGLLLTEQFKEIIGHLFPLLLDHNKNVARTDVEVFTYKKGSIDEYQIPGYVNIAFIDDTLYNKLIEKFDLEIEKLRIGNEHLSRPLKRLIGSIVNLGSNDITDVVRNVTRAFNNKIKEQGVDINAEFKIYIGCLFNIFKKNPDRKGTLSESINLLNRNREVVPSADLFLGKEFSSGTVTELLFEGIYDNSVYLLGNEFWQLIPENSDTAFLEDFFIWLGVNKYTKFKSEVKNFSLRENDGYTPFVFDNIGWPDYEPHKFYLATSVENFDKIVLSKAFSIEKLIGWIIKDSSLHIKLDNENNGDHFEYSYGNNTRIVSSKPSYFLYQLAKAKIADDLFVDFEFAEYLGLKSINPKHQLFIDLDIETTVLDVLKKLGAKMSFNDLAIEKVYSLLNIEQLDHSKARKIYQLAFNYFKNTTTKCFDTYTKQSTTLASNNGIKKYKPTSEVYYSDNTTLPSKIIEDFWIFDFPKRSGEKQVAEYFGVKTFKDISIQINSGVSYHQAATHFNKWLSKIKPFILTYRLNSITKGNLEKRFATLLKNISIKLVSNLEYTVNGGASKLLLPNEFISNDQQVHFICAEPSLSLEQLKETPAFCEAFAEILCVLFEVNENKDDFRAIFKDKEHLKDTHYLIATKLLSEKYEEACRLLGVAITEMEFWKAIAQNKGVDFTEAITTTEELQSLLLAKFNYTLPDYYNSVNFDDFDNQRSFDFLKEIASFQYVSLTEIKNVYPNFQGLKAWHKLKFLDVSNTVEPLLNKALWLFYSDKTETEQREFETKRKIYHQKINAIVLALANDYSLDIQVNYTECLIAQLSVDFNIKIDKAELKEVVIENKYQKLLEESRLIAVELPEEIQSLLFFSEHEELLKMEFSKLEEKEEKQDDSSADGAGDMDSVNVITTSLLKGTLPPVKTGNPNGRKKGGTHSEKGDKLKKKAGKRSEKLVRDKLIALYPEGEVFWISGNSDDNKVTLDDSKGYDIKYRANKTDQEWKYLEVKSISDDSFIISANEVNVGIERKENYHLALVSGKDIYFVKDFFLDEVRVAEFNVLRNSGSIRPLDYEVYFQIEKKF